MIRRVHPDCRGGGLFPETVEQMTDERLLSLCRSTGEDELFAQMVRRHQRPLHGYLRRFLRQVVRLVFFQGLKYQDAADTLSLPVGAVKSRMHAALHQLRTIWPASPAGPGDVQSE